MEKLYKDQIRQFGLKIKKIREAKSYTQQDLADKCEVDIRTIQRIERGDSAIGLRILFSLARAFDIPPYELLKNLRFDSVEKN